MQKTNTVLIVVIALLLAPMTFARAGESSKFLRFVGDGVDGGELQTSIVTYRNADGVSVDLIGAVHIADAAYFDALNERFDDYDAVLFEMVRPRAAAEGPTTGPATAPTRARAGGGMRWVGTMQRFMRDHLELEYQLEAIDYDRANFVHADLDIETFIQKQRERGESMMQLMMRAMMREMARGPAARGKQPNLGELLHAMQSPDRARRLKLILAKQFQQMDEMLASLEGPKGSVILSERNKAALKVLEDRIAMGERKLAIFYGAGHLNGMQKILTEEMGFEQLGEPVWITAWDLTEPATTQPAEEPAVTP